MVRLTTGVHAGGHEFISTAHEDQKFGLSVAVPPGQDSPALVAIRAVLARPELELVGLHSHVGSQILDASGLVVAARRMMQVRAQVAAATGVLVDEVDLGGGFGIAYLPGDEAPSPSMVAPEPSRNSSSMRTSRESSGGAASGRRANCVAPGARRTVWDVS